MNNKVNGSIVCPYCKGVTQVELQVELQVTTEYTSRKHIKCAGWVEGTENDKTGCTKSYLLEYQFGLIYVQKYGLAPLIDSSVASPTCVPI